MFMRSEVNAPVRRWRILSFVIRFFNALAQHHQLHAQQPIGMFAGSLLPRCDWDHS
jgi:hypothetical protein